MTSSAFLTHNPATVWPVPDEFRPIYSHAAELQAPASVLAEAKTQVAVVGVQRERDLRQVRRREHANPMLPLIEVAKT